MKEVTEANPQYAYLDTYASLLYKPNQKNLAKKVAEKALKIADNHNTENLQKLLKNL